MQSTVVVDESAWPLLMFHFTSEMMLDDVDVYNGALDAALARGEPFGAVMVASPNTWREGAATRWRTRA